MKLCVQYFNSRTNEHDKYETTFDELVDSFGWGELEFGDAITHTLNSQLIDSGKAIIKTRLDFIGTKSFGIEHRILDEQGEVCAEGKDVVVYFDFNKKETIPVPEEIREIISRF